MPFSTNYIDESLYYLPWKTKFIEVYCILYAKLLKKIEQQQAKEQIVDLYLELYKLMLNILQKKLKSDDNLVLTFYPEIINHAEKKQYITNKQQYFEVLDFLSLYNINKSNVNDFQYCYIDLLKDFARKFKYLTRQKGFRSQNYVIYDNSYCLWGIHPKYYIKLMREFLKYKHLKIVRIFGSRVTSEYHEFSDIDLILEGTYSPEEFCKIRNTLQNLELPYVLDMYDIRTGNKPFTYRNVVRSNILYMRTDYYNDNYTSIISNN